MSPAQLSYLQHLRALGCHLSFKCGLCLAWISPELRPAHLATHQSSPCVFKRFLKFRTLEARPLASRGSCLPIWVNKLHCSSVSGLKP